MKTDTVLVLGATGRCGRAAARAFADAGWRLRTLARRPAGPDAPHGDHRVGDVLDPATLSAAADGVDVVVNALNPPYGRWANEVPRFTDAVLGAARSSGATVLLPGNVYGFGESMPQRLDADTPERPSTALGRVRAGLERRYRDAAVDGARTVVLRAGDFIEGRATGNWFEDHVIGGLAKGRVRYPGPLDRAHAWAWLPDVGRAMVGLAERRESLEPFESIGLPGWTLTGHELVAALEGVVGRELVVERMPWPLLRLASVASADLRGVVSMRYLWERPHRLDGAALAERLPGFVPTPVDEGLRAALSGLGAATRRAAG